MYIYFTVHTCIDNSFNFAYNTKAHESQILKAYIRTIDNRKN